MNRSCFGVFAAPRPSRCPYKDTRGILQGDPILTVWVSEMVSSMEYLQTAFFVASCQTNLPQGCPMKRPPIYSTLHSILACCSELKQISLSWLAIAKLFPTKFIPAFGIHGHACQHGRSPNHDPHLVAKISEVLKFPTSNPACRRKVCVTS